MDTPCCGATGWVIRSAGRTNASHHELSTGVPSAIRANLSSSRQVGKHTKGHSPGVAVAGTQRESS